MFLAMQCTLVVDLSQFTELLVTIGINATAIVMF